MGGLIAGGIPQEDAEALRYWRQIYALRETPDPGWTWVEHVINGTRLPAKEVIHKDPSQPGHFLAWPLWGGRDLKADPKDVALEVLWGAITAEARKAYTSAISDAMAAHYERLCGPPQQPYVNEQGEYVKPEPNIPPTQLDEKKSRLQALEESKDAVHWEEFFPRSAQFQVYFGSDWVKGWMA